MVVWLFPFTAYGTWLHGDERGSVDRRHNDVGTPTLKPSLSRRRAARLWLVRDPMPFTSSQRRCITLSIRETCTYFDWPLFALNVRTTHVHAVCASEKPPERVMNAMKAYATRRLVSEGLVPPQSKVWSRHGSIRQLGTEQSVRRACEYVLDRQGDSRGTAVAQYSAW